MHDLCGEKRTIDLNTVWVCALPGVTAGPHRDDREEDLLDFRTHRRAGHVPDQDPDTLIHNPDEFLPIEFDYDKETGVKTKLRRFYVAHPKIQDNHNTWAKSTLQEAIDHATELVEKTGQTQYIVKIIKVVSRAKPPIKVEDAR